MNTTQYKEYFSREFQGMNDAIDKVFTPIFGEFTPNEIPTANDYVIEYGNGGANIDHIYDYGTYYTDSTNVSVFEVVLSDNCQISRARKNIQNTVRKITDRYAGAFIIFHYADGSNNSEAHTWRLSWLKRLDVHRKDSPAKRYTYLCGPSYSCRTIAQRFDDLQKTSNKTLDTITAAFDVEALSKEFFDEYKIFYEDIVQYICGKRIVPQKGQKGWENVQIESNDIIAKRGIYTCFQKEFPGIDTHGNINAEKAVRDYVKKLMGRLVFIQFLQKKGWLGLPSTQDSWTGGDIHFLVNIFKNHQDQKDDFVNQVLVKILFDSFNKADSCHDGIKYPYLNGGLFEQDQADKLPIKLPSELFVSDYPETSRKFNGLPNANEEYDYKKTEGLFQFFERYNFTIDENDPNDAIVGVDPEMLGKIFENLLEDNKDKGAFYTPKEIVQYMCKESLIAYLCSEIKGIDNDIRKLVEEGECGDVVSDHKKEVISALKAVKICDPAIGSGAFPMGLLNLLVHLRETLGETDRCQLKKDIILNNIYGVDIEKGAVDIARLRFWLSIMVDDDKPSPLPNFDFKFMQGNSLLETYEGVDLSKIAGSKQKKTSNAQTNLVFDEKDVLNNIQVLLKQYFKLQGTEKEKCKQNIEKGVKEYIRFMTEGIDKEKQDKLLDINMSANDQFFLWHTWFADVFEKGGFNIVIGNPPYFLYQENHVGEIEELRSIKDYKIAFGGKLNAYKLFIANALAILCKNDGVMCVICQNSLLADKQATNLRKYILEHNHFISIDSYPERDNKKKRVFESVKMSVCIPIVRKQKCNDYFKVNIWDDKNKAKGIKTKFTLSEIKSMDPKEYAIPRLKSEYTPIVIKLIKQKKINLKCYEGELNMSFHKKYFTSDTSNPIILKGAAIQRYYYTLQMSQGEIEYLDENKYLKDLGRTKKSGHHNYPRIAMQGMTGANDKTRIVMSIVPKGYYLANSCNYLFAPHPFVLESLLGFLNSKVINWYFRCFSTNSNVNGYEVDSLPLPSLSSDHQRSIINLVKKILSEKKANLHKDTKPWEQKIDILVYILYGLTWDEVQVIEKDTESQSLLPINNTTYTKWLDRYQKDGTLPSEEEMEHMA